MSHGSTRVDHFGREVIGSELPEVARVPEWADLSSGRIAQYNSMIGQRSGGEYPRVLMGEVHAYRINPQTGQEEHLGVRGPLHRDSTDESRYYR